jgi:dihydrofolate reductase
MTAHSLDIVIVAAVASNGAIGGNNALLWRLPSDLKHFREITMDRPIIMGRKTFESIGRPLPGRTNIVVSRNPSFVPSGVIPAASLNDALEIARADADQRGVQDIAIIGGGQIYAEAMAFADRLEITEVAASPSGDVFFPELDPTIWRERKRKQAAQAPNDDHEFAFVTYERVR